MQLRSKTASTTRPGAGAPAAPFSLKTVHSALRKTTEVLANEVARPTAVAPLWTETEWRIARASVAIHGVGALLANRLRWQGPPGWAEFLAEQRAHTAERFQRLHEVLGQIDRAFAEEGIALVALKGAALNEMGLYEAGERPMADIDLLVHEKQAAQAIRVVERLGYRQSYSTPKEFVFAPPGYATPAALGEDSENYLKIELHTELTQRLPLRPVEISTLVFPEKPLPGLNPYPSKGVLLMHVLLHASGDMTRRGARLLQLTDIARLAASMTHLDWEDILKQAERTAQRTLWWAYPPLALTTRYYGCIPDWVLARTAADCHGWLKRVSRHRTLSESSLSHLWVSAFPGIEWARSMGEMLAYMRARVAPSAETLELRRTFATAQPRVSGGQWAELSQGRRILRWLMAPQARQGTLQPVLAALGQAP